VTRYEVAVIGAGLMGAATAWQLARRGVSVVLVEQHEPGHRHGSSHGSSRIFRRAYADPFYVRLTGAARDGWAEAVDDTGKALLRTTGGIDHGPGRDPVALAALMAQAGVPHELLTAADAAARWDGIRFAGPVLLHPEAGVIDADAAVAAWVGRAEQLGATVLLHHHVHGFADTSSGVTVRTEHGDLLADTVVLAVGAWLPVHGQGLHLPELTVTQQQVFHFPGDVTGWPTLVHKDVLQVYGLPSGRDVPGAPAYKVAEHDHGTVTTAAGRSATVDPASRTRVQDYVREWLPGLDPEPVLERTCLYTTTADDDFLLDRVGRVVVASPCSGHGAKFAPLIGAMAADLATGLAQAEPRFALRA
jgi:monomeric sarcosine oxidase